MKYGAASSSKGGQKDGYACLQPREGKTNAGAIARPPGAPPPSSKGSISYPDQAVKGK